MFFVMGIAVAASLLNMFPSDRNGGFEISPRVHDVSRQFAMEGQMLRFVSVIKSGPVPCTVEFKRPCGCITIADEEGREIGNSLTLAHSQSKRIEIRFETHGKLGKIGYEIPLVVRQPTGEVIRKDVLRIATYLQSGLVSCPSSFHLTKQRPRQTIAICDGLSSQRERVKSVSSNDPRVSVSFEKTEGDLVFGGWKLNKRALIEVAIEDFSNSQASENRYVEVVVESLRSPREERVILVPLLVEDSIIRLRPAQIHLEVDGSDTSQAELSVYRSDVELPVTPVSVPPFCTLSNIRSANGFEYFEIEASEGVGEIEFAIGSQLARMPVVVTSKGKVKK